MEMRKRQAWRREIAAATACIAALAFYGCGPSEAPGPQFRVSMLDNTFRPPLLRVPVDTAVEFTNDGRNPHNAVADDWSWSTKTNFGDLVMPAGARATVNFPEAGVFPYFCTFHGAPGGIGMAATLVVGDVPYKATGAGRATAVAEASGVTRRVPQDYPTIQAGVDAAQPGDLVLVDRGVYREEVTITTPSLTLRGVDRNEVIIDGQFMRGNGVLVLADGVAVENMTARNTVLNGFFWISVTGYRGSYLTAVNNGDYGIYAFDSVDGLLEHSYASGSPDSGFYVGQCHPCRTVLRSLIAEHNALGYSGTNSGGQLYIVSSIWRYNQAGIAPNTLDTELLPPERETTIVGNLVVDNNDRNAPVRSMQAPIFGNGILLAGGRRNRVERNVIVGHEQHGILVAPNYSAQFWTARDNVVRDNFVRRSGRADLAEGGPGSFGNCFADNDFESSTPPGLETLEGCSGLRLPLGQDAAILSALAVRAWRGKRGLHPQGEVADQPLPPPQPQLPGGAAAPVRPAVHVFENVGLDLAQVELPAEAARWQREASSQTPLPAGARFDASRLRVTAERWAAFLPLVLYAGWALLALADLRRRQGLSVASRSAWSAVVVLLPWVGALTYHGLGRPELARSRRVLAIAGGIALYLASIAVGGWLSGTA